MCKNCNQTDGYAQAMQNAVSIEKRTGVEQAVFTMNGVSYFGARKEVAKQEGICCYILTTGEEIKIKIKAETEKKKANPKPEVPADSDKKDDKDSTK